ncbi:hypothetical protein C361_03890 [Cryptococcus neoformans Tu259-1]|uniref:Uncharacterized protein n=1 Tax=Cryptococcus neoformans Tu259-1 TaxID=1230072 RepID=A0A854QA17_CRYNE|nr:hypothetical protein C361_03890 [Cryptococcus neoformans var. grubii Tu259-1]
MSWRFLNDLALGSLAIVIPQSVPRLDPQNSSLTWHKIP